MIMLKSVSLNIADMRALTANGDVSKNLMRCLADVNEQLLADVIKVLEPFDAATKQLSADRRPTMHQVVATRHKLRSHTAALPTDTAIIHTLKTHLIAQLDKYFHVTDYHRVAMLLDPRLKNNTIIVSADERNDAIELLKKMVEDTVISHLVNLAIQHSNKKLDTPPAKKMKVSRLLCLLWAIVCCDFSFFI